MLLIALPCRAEITDVPKAHEAYPAVQKLLQNNIIKPPTDGLFNGDNPVEMYQLAVVLNNIIQYTGKKAEVEAKPLADFYTDVPESHYAYEPVKNLVKLRVFTVPASRKFSGLAKPDRDTFYSYMAVFLEALEGKKLPSAPPNSAYADVPADNFAYPYLQKLIGAGLLDGNGRFDGGKKVTRYEMAVFLGKLLDYYAPAEGKPAVFGRTAAAPAGAAVAGYIDIPDDNFAREAVADLVDAGILPSGRGGNFYGNNLIDRYLLVDFIGRIVEKIVAGDESELELASPALAYKDVPVSYYAYRSIQKLVALGVIPPGNRRELFYGDRRITRYQMAFFVFSAIEKVLAEVIDFQAADPSLGYADVPDTHFVYNSIQKLIWLGVFEGGAGNSFNGDEYVSRYELCYFTVDLVKAVFVKLREEKEKTVTKPVNYGFTTYLDTELTGIKTDNGKAPGKDLINLYGYQSLSLAVNRRLNEILSVFGSLRGTYYLGNTPTTNTFYVYSAYTTLNYPSFLAQVGRSNFYLGYTPFGNSLFIDADTLDAALINYDHSFFNLYSGIGKLVHMGDIYQDSNVGFASLSPKLPPFLNWLELAAGSSLITDLPDQAFTVLLPTRATQMYGGLKANLLNRVEFTAEIGKVDYSDYSALVTAGFPAVGSFEASQYALTYYAPDYGYSLSLGYQKIGSAYYLSLLDDPSTYLSVGRGTESYLLKTKFYPSTAQTVGLELAYVLAGGTNTRNTVYAYYNHQLIDAAYLNLSATKLMDNTAAAQSQLTLTSALSVSF